MSRFLEADPASSTYPRTRKDLIAQEFEGALRLSLPGAPHVEVAPTVGSLVRSFDGRRSVAEIDRDLGEMGVTLPGPDFLLALAQYLAGHGLVELLTEPIGPPSQVLAFLSLHNLNHRCQRTGACCHEHLVEVDESVAETLSDDHRTLAAEFSRFEQVEPTRTVTAGGRRVVALAHDEMRRCIYLEPEIGCLLQARFGADRKPIACRMFPLEVIRTGTELRVGFSGACFGLHATFEDELSLSPVEHTGIAAADFPNPVSRGMDPEHPSELDDTPSKSSCYGQHLALEERLIKLAMAPDTDLDDIYCVVLGLGSDEPPERRSLKDPAVAEALGDTLTRFGRSLVTVVADGQGPEGSASVANAGLAKLLAERSHSRPFLGLRPQEQRFAFYTLREWLYLRDWHLQVDLATGMMVRLMGMVVGSWVREDVESGTMEPPPFAPPFASGLTLWARLVRTDAHFARLFETREQVRELIKRLTSQ